MMASSRRRKRPRGRIEKLTSGSLRVSVYAGIHPLTKRRIYIRETIPAGSRAQAEAERALTRLLNQVDEKRQPRTSATVEQLLDRYLGLLDVGASTRRGYDGYIRKHVRPALGSLRVGRVNAGVLESFYAELRRCRDHCDGRPNASHTCRPLAPSSIRQIHWILSGAFGRAVRWDWIAINPADRAEPPARIPAKPTPPAVDEAARLIEEAARRDPDWGAFIWVTATTGARRGEMCALHWDDLDLDNKVIHLHRAISLADGAWVEKDTKTHQHRRVVLDGETVEVLREHLLRCQKRAESLGVDLARSAYVFSPSPDNSTFLVPDSVTQRYDRMAERLGIETTLHKLRHFSATELINGGVDVRTVAGRLGHAGGGATTLRVYAAWLSEADQRAAATLSGRMPARHRAARGNAQVSEPSGRPDEDPPGPYAQIANDLRAAIRIGVMKPGDQLPTIKDLADRYDVAASTAHRAVRSLRQEGLVEVSRGRRGTVA